MTSLLSSSFRLWSLVPRVSRSLATRARASPEPRGTHLLPAASHLPLILSAEPISTPEEFLKAIGRSADTKLSIENSDWDEFWGKNGRDLKAAGLGVRDRRYILWCMEKYRSGLPINAFAHEPKPKKTVRGWGPTVQNGVRIRSRRDRTKSKRPKTTS
ncbi:hypothetical protein C8R43DRAFT_890251 [Mycena crocata]|nr:hypothetical protein C8R43DRAFT_890251 [Mycena crocata]